MSELTSEARRLAEDAARTRNWKRWGPYLSERQWSTVREDYSEYGTCWDYFPHDHARSRAYRWGEDGLLGITDRECRLCFGPALWNGKDAILKERLFGLTANEGNHGEDVKEDYFFLDSTPTHSYLKALYKYPQREFPYGQLVAENARRTRADPEYELVDTGVFAESRYFDVGVEYAKNSPNDILIRITITNRGPDAATLHLLPSVWFRNTWSWGCTHEGCTLKPRIATDGARRLACTHETLGRFFCEFEDGPDGRAPRVLFTDNETNHARLHGSENSGRFVKDAFHECVIGGRADAVNAKGYGTKAAPWYVLDVAAGAARVVRLRLYAEEEAPKTAFGAGFEAVMAQRIREADEFYESVSPTNLTRAETQVIRQGYAGLLWSKQFYHYVVADWINGDPGAPAPPAGREKGRNREWKHLFSRDIFSMPDAWEYPWFAAWDLAFHMIPFARIDGEFAKGQLSLLLREWYMHPNGQIPAYEFAFGDVNPPVHAWAAWRVYKISARAGERDRDFLESVFHKLLLNFTWWVNRKDANGENLFSGGFLGLDNVGVFDRSKPLPTGGSLQQADGTAWMAFYSLTMLAISLELAHDGTTVHRAYEDMASKFFEHFIQIADAMNTLGGTGLWHEQDGFYYDQVLTGSEVIPLKTRSMVGLLPLIAVEVLEEDRLRRLPGFYKRLEWFVKNRPELAQHVTHCENGHHRRLLAIPSKARLLRVLRYLLDEAEFLSPFGIRSLSKFHAGQPYIFNAGGEEHRVDYVPGESTSGLFGGNSNWRGPVWFPVNYLLVEALERFHHFYGNDVQVEFPTGSGRMLNLRDIGCEIERRLASLFLPDENGRRACHGDDPRFATDPHWRELVLFHEYFHGESGKGLGASHQTGWTALVIRLLKDAARKRGGDTSRDEELARQTGRETGGTSGAERARRRRADG
ncbi:glucosidase [Verrucomicrobiota bacterium]|nr:glucosidase [Verrucomicrobiota bacterium]